ncbi:MAG: aldo/keto reductase [Anaerolineae bacterium]
MQYRQFGKLGWQASALGFGCMRLPTLGSYGNVDEPQAIRMIHHAIDRGVNYLDTGYSYHEGNSERVLGQALRDGYREKAKVATKLPMWQVETAADPERLLNEQLQRLGVEQIDVYLFHGIRQARWDTIQRLDLLRWAERAVADGRVGALGFSFHDSLDLFKTVVDAYDSWAMCQVLYNYMDTERQAGTAGVRYAAAKGLAVVVMEPLMGGNLVNPPPEVQTIWDSAPVKRTPADWALQWLWHQPEVAVALSGMSTMAQVDENVASAERSAVGSLSPMELSLVDMVSQQYEWLRQVDCSRCSYCMPCPNGVNIPRNFEIYNQGFMFNRIAEARRSYAELPEGERAAACVACGTCESLCPQELTISELMPQVDAVLGQGADYPEM